MTKVALHDNLLGRGFWSRENLKYVEPHFRLYKIAKALVELSQGQDCDLLDVGCGPAALAKLLPGNFHYFGIDIAIHEPAPNLIESDIVNSDIRFGDMRFDFVVASGVFEYVGKHQRKKLAEIHQVTKADGYFVMSYVNFDHINKRIWPKYSNVESGQAIRRDITSFFEIRRVFPTFHHWVSAVPKIRLIQEAQAGIYFRVPVISSLLADEFVYVCTPRKLEPLGIDAQLNH